MSKYNATLTLNPSTIFTDINAMTAKFTPIKVLIADEDHMTSRRLAEFLESKGFITRIASTGREARTELLEWVPRYLIADLLLADHNAFELIDFIKQEPLLRHQIIHTFVTSRHNTETNVKAAFQRGAKDYLVKPFSFDDVLKRLVFHTRNHRSLGDVAAKDLKKFDEAGLMLHLTDLVLRQALNKGTLEDILFNLTRMVSMRVEGVRCSIVQCLDQKAGVVVTSNDDRKASGLKLDLYKYPEVLHVMNTNKLIAIENIAETAEMRHIRDHVQEITFNSIIVCPITHNGVSFGVLSLRLPPERTSISDNEIRFVEIVAHVTSLVIGAEAHKADFGYWMKTMRTPQVIAFPKK